MWAVSALRDRWSTDAVDRWAMDVQKETFNAERKMRGSSKLGPAIRSFIGTKRAFGKEMYKAYVVKHHPSLAENMMSKVFWNHVFVQHGVPQPRMHATCIKGQLTTYTAEDDESPTGYIVKPNRGLAGRGVRRVDTCPSCVRGEEDWVCQERVVNCGEYTEHYRIVTLWDGRVFSVSLMQSGVPNAVTSNLAMGGSSEMLCYGHGCQMAFPDVVRDISHQLADVHKLGFDVVFSIGWDVIVSCDPDGTPGRAFALEGNLKNGGKQWTKAANNAYREQLREFLRQHPHYL
jgi:hypothetical protein